MSGGSSRHCSSLLRHRPQPALADMHVPRTSAADVLSASSILVSHGSSPGSAPLSSAASPNS
eukprot:30174-Eustigmatos_ZCMA.PRE.1